MTKLYHRFLLIVFMGFLTGLILFSSREIPRQNYDIDSAAPRRKLFRNEQLLGKATEKPRAVKMNTVQKQRKSDDKFLNDTSPLRWEANQKSSNFFNANATVPKLVHFTWYSTKKLTFRFHHFISALSAYKHIQPNKFMFWHERPPIGKWWEETLRRIPNIQMVYRKAPTSIYGNSIKISEHQSDVVRLEAILKYGGIYMDLDIIALKYFGQYKLFTDKKWNVHSVKIPAELAKAYPELIHTEEDTFHKPNWKNTKWLYSEGFLYDWSRNYAVHLWYRFHKKDHTPEDIKTINTTMGELFRFIYYGSPELIL
jgi:hypothetical protein